MTHVTLPDHERPTLPDMFAKRHVGAALHVEVDGDYWPMRFPEWKSMTQEEQQRMMRKEIEHIMRWAVESCP